jgi:hypothetical protein
MDHGTNISPHATAANNAGRIRPLQAKYRSSTANGASTAGLKSAAIPHDAPSKIHTDHRVDCQCLKVSSTASTTSNVEALVSQIRNDTDAT